MKKGIFKWKGKGQSKLETDTVYVGGLYTSQVSGKVMVQLYPYNTETKKKGNFYEPYPYDDFKRDFEPYKKKASVQKSSNMEWTITGKYVAGEKFEINGSMGRWSVKDDTRFSIEVSRFSELFDQRKYPMMPVPSGRGRDMVEYRLSKKGDGVVMDQIHYHSRKPVKMIFRRALVELKINGQPATEQMLEKAVKFLSTKYR